MSTLIGKTVTTTENRVKTNGEVFTPDSIVNEMLDASDRKINEHQSDNISYIDRIILEPTCGNGNILIRILERKLKQVLTIQDQQEKEIAILRSLASINGIDITAENVTISKLRMLELLETGKTDIFELGYKTPQPFSIGTGFSLTPDMRKSVQSILDRNIQCGNLLTNEKLSIWKSSYVSDIWNLDKNKLSIGDSLLRTDQPIGELEITQYNFENNTVQLRTKTLQNMKNHKEVYSQATRQVPYSRLYELGSPQIYVKDIIDIEEDEFDF